ncbi:MAG: peptidylprolyl isomerase, partial [Pseudomonadota bacterium]
NLTVFGRVIDGMEHVQALKRQPPPEEEGDPLGETIVRAWMGDAPPEGEDAPTWQVFRTDTALFAEYVESRRNRPEAFFYYRPDHVDVCQLTIPVREKPAPKKTADE